MLYFWSRAGVEQLIAGGTPLLLIAVRTLIVYVVMVVGLRATGKREIGQFTSFDLVLVLLLANAVQNAMVGQDNTLLGGLVAAITLLSANWFVGYLTERNDWLDRWLLGKPRKLVVDGRVLQENLKAESLTEDELLASIREHGLEDPSQVGLAMLEVDGTISVVSKDDVAQHARRRVRQIKHGQ